MASRPPPPSARMPKLLLPLTASWRPPALPPRRSEEALLPEPQLPQTWMPLQAVAPRAAAAPQTGGAAAVLQAPATGRCCRLAHAARLPLGCVGVCAGAARQCQRGTGAAAWIRGSLPSRPGPLHGGGRIAPHDQKEEALLPSATQCGRWKAAHATDMMVSNRTAQQLKLRAKHPQEVRVHAWSAHLIA